MNAGDSSRARTERSRKSSRLARPVNASWLACRPIATARRALLCTAAMGARSIGSISGWVWMIKRRDRGQDGQHTGCHGLEPKVGDEDGSDALLAVERNDGRDEHWLATRNTTAATNAATSCPCGYRVEDVVAGRTPRRRR